MHLVKSLLVVVLAIPMAIAGPRGELLRIPLTQPNLLTLYIGNALRRRAGDGKLPLSSNRSVVPCFCTLIHQLYAKRPFAELPKPVLHPESATSDSRTMLSSFLLLDLP